MKRKILDTIWRVLPPVIRNRVRDRYWRIKSNFLYSRLYQWLQLEYTLQSGLTLRVASKAEWWTYNDIFVNHEYDSAIELALACHSVGCPFTVLDLGANVGYFSLRVIDLMRQSLGQNGAADLTLIEGSPNNFRELELRLGSQVLSPSGLRMIPGLVGRRNGSGTISESAIHVKNTIMRGAANRGVSVDFVDVSNLMSAKPQIDLLKCDIEGAEQLFIENYPELFCKVRTAVFEFHDDLCDTERCESLLALAGFRQKILRSSPGISIRLFARS